MKKCWISPGDILLQPPKWPPKDEVCIVISTEDVKSYYFDVSDEYIRARVLNAEGVIEEFEINADEKRSSWRKVDIT